MKKCFLKKFCNLVFFFKNKDPRVAHVNLNGVIGRDSKFDKGLNFENIFPLLQNAFNTDGIKAVAISINSPGGSPVQSELIYKGIRELSEEKKIPVYTFAQDVAASGGYWLLLSGDEIYAHSSSIIGSIGVIFSGFGFVDAIKKIGIERRIYAEGKNKSILDPFTPENQDNISILKQAQKDIFESFKELVITRRRGKISTEIDFLDNNIFTGAFWSGKTSRDLGLIDEICDMRQKMKEKFGAKVKIITIENKKGFIKSLFASKSNDDVVLNIINRIEEKILMQNFGLK